MTTFLLNTVQTKGNINLKSLEAKRQILRRKDKIGIL